MPHRIPVAAQFTRQHPLHALRLRVGQGVELGVEVGPQPNAVTPHIGIVFDAVLMTLEPRRGVEPRHPHVERRLPGVMAGIGGAEFGMLEDGGIELDDVDVVSRDLLRHADESSGAVPPRACSSHVTPVRASAPHQDVQGGNQPHGARIDTGEVVDQTLGHQTELRTVPSHAS